MSCNRTGAVYVLYCAQDDDELCGCKLLYPIDERKKSEKTNFCFFFLEV
jgi:hypothetical protein